MDDIVFGSHATTETVETVVQHCIMDFLEKFNSQIEQLTHEQKQRLTDKISCWREKMVVAIDAHLQTNRVLTRNDIRRIQQTIIAE